MMVEGGERRQVCDIAKRLDQHVLVLNESGAERQCQHALTGKADAGKENKPFQECDDNMVSESSSDTNHQKIGS